MCDPEIIEAFAVGELSVEDAIKTRTHLITCRTCRKTLDLLRTHIPEAAKAERFVETTVVADLRQLQLTLDQRSEVGVALLPQLLSASADTWRAAVAADDRLRTTGVVRALVDVIDATYSELPVRAVELATLAADIADMIEDADEVWRARTLAWRKVGSALGSRGQLRDAIAAFDLAESCVIPTWPDRAVELAMIDNARVPVLRLCGKTADARRLIGPAKLTFARFEQSKPHAYALYNEATLDYGDGDYESALRTFTAAAERMRFLGEQHMEALCHHALGQCAARVGDAAAAVHQWAKAKVLFERVGMHGEKARLTQAIGRMRIANGDVEDGLSDLRAAEATFEEFAMRLDAIDASLEIVETLIANDLQHMEVYQRCHRAVARAERAGLGIQSAVAIAHLRRVATDGDLDIDYIRHVRQFVRDANANPGVPFQPPVRNLR